MPCRPAAIAPSNTCLNQGCTNLHYRHDQSGRRLVKALRQRVQFPSIRALAVTPDCCYKYTSISTPEFTGLNGASLPATDTGRKDNTRSPSSPCHERIGIEPAIRFHAGFRRAAIMRAIKFDATDCRPIHWRKIAEKEQRAMRDLGRHFLVD